MKREVINSPRNLALTREYEAKLEEHDRQQAAKAKIFDPKALLERASKIHEVNHPTLGLLRFGELTLEDSKKIASQCKTDEEKTAMALFLMLKKAYPDLPDMTPEEFWKKFPMMEGGQLLNYFTAETGFLSPSQNSRNGLKLPRKLK
jgi:hypothetical protein